MTSNLSKTEQAHERRESFLDLHGKSRLLEIKILYLLFRDNDYKRLGFESFKDFCQAPRGSGGLDISREWATELIQTYKKYVVELGQPESLLIDASPRKLYYLKEKATKENVLEVIEEAKNMTLVDLIREARNVNLSTCAHHWVEWKRCSKCLTWEKKKKK